MLVEWCCEKNSRSADWFVRHGHAALRLSLPEWDVRSEGRVDDVLERIVSAQRRVPNCSVGGAPMHSVVGLAVHQRPHHQCVPAAGGRGAQREPRL
eukprot:15083097-Heterocapsa_arctica.AAC.1